MNHKSCRFLLCLIALLGGALMSPVYGGLRDNNLIELSFGSYPLDSREYGKPMVWPPVLKFYRDGKVVSYDESANKYYVGRLDAQMLASLKKRLSSESYLRKSRFIELDGDEI